LLTELASMIAGLEGTEPLEGEEFIDRHGMLLDHIKGVFAAKYNVSPVQARIRHKIPEESVFPGVIIQKPIKASIAGTMYTAHDVSGDRNQVAVMASHGQGAAVVGEAGQTAQFYGDKITREVLVKSAKSQVESKYELLRTDFYYVRSSFNFEDLIELRTAGFYDSYPDRSDAGKPNSPIAIVNVSTAEKGEELFTPDSADNLLRWAERIEGLFEYRPQDIEWSQDEKGVWFVQSRPQKTDQLPTEHSLDVEINKRVGEIPMDILIGLKKAMNDRNLKELVEALQLDIGPMIMRDKVAHARKVVAARYLLSLSMRVDFPQIVAMASNEEALLGLVAAIDAGWQTVIGDPITSHQVFDFVARINQDVPSGPVKEKTSAFFSKLGQVPIPYGSHLLSFGIARGLIANKQYDLAITKLKGTRETGAADPGVADRALRLVRKIPIQFSRDTLEFYAGNPKVPHWVQTFATRIIDTLEASARGGSESRSELRDDDRSNPYIHEENIDRSFANLDALHGGLVSKVLDNRTIPNAPPQKVLFVGLGRGKAAIDLVRKYGDKIELYSLTLEDLLYTPEQLAEVSAGDISLDEARILVAKVQSRYTLANIEKGYGAFDGESFDVIIFGQAVFEYINDKGRLIESLKQKLVPGGELIMDLLIMVLRDQAGKTVQTDAFFAAQGSDYKVYGLTFGGPPIIGYPGLHIINNNPSQWQLPLDATSRGTTYRVRSELRIPSSEEFKVDFAAEQISSPVVEGLLEPFIPGIRKAAAVLNSIYSPDTIASSLDGISVAAAEAWVRQELVRIILEAEGSFVSDPELQSLVARLIPEKLASSGSALAGEQGPAVHVGLEKAPQDAASFLPILAVIAAHGGALHLNIAEAKAPDLQVLESEILAAARKKGIKLRNGQFTITAAGAETFVTVPHNRFASGEHHGLLGELTSVESYPRRKGIHLFQMDGEAVARAEILAAYIITVIRALALDKQVDDYLGILDPRKMAPDAFGNIVQMISTYLEAQARLSASA